MKLKRILKHLLAPHWLARRAFPPPAMKAIEAAIAASERQHASQLRFVVEVGLPLADLWRGVSARERATEVFSRLRVWDTEHNSGVLIYVQLIDRRVEILADRGIAARVEQHEWDAICRGMEQAFRSKDFQRGVVGAIEKASKLLISHFPSSSGNDKFNELPDAPVVL